MSLNQRVSSYLGRHGPTSLKWTLSPSSTCFLLSGLSQRPVTELPLNTGHLFSTSSLYKPTKYRSLPTSYLVEVSVRGTGVYSSSIKGERFPLIFINHGDINNTPKLLKYKHLSYVVANSVFRVISSNKLWMLFTKHTS